MPGILDEAPAIAPTGKDRSGTLVDILLLLRDNTHVMMKRYQLR